MDSCAVDKAPSSTMDDDCGDRIDTRRRTRNLSEKKRRDQFNMLVTELGSLITNNSSKMDKSSVLKSTITFLKNHNELTVRSRAHGVKKDWKPAFLSNDEFTYLVLEAIEAFVMVFSPSGRIYYVSDSISSLLGHNVADLINKNIFELTLEEDQNTLYNLLQKNVSAAEQMQNTSKEGEMIRFQIPIQRGTLGCKKDLLYEVVQFYGHFRLHQELVEDDRDNMMDIYRHEVEPGMIFVCIGRLHTPLLMRDVSLVDSTRNEFTSRHSLEWKFLFLDHRAPPIIGYLPFEVLGTSGYDYYHFDDLEKVVTCHEALIEKGELTSCYYRFLTKGQEWIWLQTRFYITYHQWNSKPEFVVCTHRVVSSEDVGKTNEESVAQEKKTETEASQTHVMDDSASDEPMPPISLTHPTKAHAYESSYQPSQNMSAKSASASSTSGTINTAASTDSVWPRMSSRYHSGAGGSDTASLSEESYASCRNSEIESHNSTETRVAPQHSISAQYLDQSIYGVGVLVSSGALMPISTVPVLVTQDQTQNQDQLQRKHEELRQMIVRQQEELRVVKEQLLLARLGLLQPIINIPNAFATPEQNQQRMTTQLGYTNPPQVTAGYAHHVMLSEQSYSAHAPQSPLTTHLSQTLLQIDGPLPSLNPHLTHPPRTPDPPLPQHPQHATCSPMRTDPPHSPLPPEPHHNIPQ